MNKPACLALGVALCCLVGVDATAAPTTRSVTPTRPQPTRAKSTASPTIRIQDRPLTRKQLRPTKNKEASAALADLLVRLADGKAETKMEKKIARQLGRSPAKRQALQRLAKRWRAAPDDQLRTTIGRVDIGGKVNKPTLQVAVDKIGPSMFWLLRPTIPMAPEAIPEPSSFQLVMSGIQSIAAHDADGTDELSTVTIFATANGNAYDLVSVDDPDTITAAGATTTALDKTLYDGAKKNVLVVTGLVEDDGSDAAASRAEIAVMIDLAAGVAATLDGADRLAVLQAMIAYTAGMQNLGDDPQAASRSIASTIVKADDWYALWGTDPLLHEAVKWKLKVPHTIGSGQYELFLTIPSVLPEMATVKVAIDKFWREDELALNQPFEFHRLALHVSVKGASAILKLDPGVTTKNWPAVYERKVKTGDVPLVFSGVLWAKKTTISPASLKTFCEQHDYDSPPCVSWLDWVTLDLAPGASSTRSTTYSTTTNKLTGDTDNKLTSQGNEGFIGGIKITVMD